jgi:hypothetical protein
MKLRFLFLAVFSVFVGLNAQNCSICVVDQSVHPNTGPEDFGLVPPSVQIYQGVDTNVVLQYLMPTQLTVSGVGTATVTKVTILSVNGLPLGLSWSSDRHPTNEYFPQTYRYGCVTLCGETYAAPGIYNVKVTVNGCGSLSGITQCQNQDIDLVLEILPSPSGNALFSYTPGIGCDSMLTEFTANITTPNPNINPVIYEWDFGDAGATATGKEVSHFYSSTGEYYVTHTTIIQELFVSQVTASVQGSWYYQDVDDGFWLFGTWIETSQADLYGTVSNGGNSISLPEVSNNNNPTWSNLNLTITDPSLAIVFMESDVLSADDPGGVATLTITGPGVYSFNAIHNGEIRTTGTITISIRNQSSQTIVDTVRVLTNSQIPVIANLTGADTVCLGDSIILESSLAGTYQWFKDGVLLQGENFQTLTTFEQGVYSLVVTDVGNICLSDHAFYEVFFQEVQTPVIDINPSTNTPFVSNPNGYAVQWFTNSTGTAIPIPGGVNDTLTNISLNNSPFTVRFTSALGCTAFSAPFAVCLPGTSSANGTLVSLGSPVVFTHNNFVLTQGNDVAWAISTSAAGPITTQAQLQAAVNAGWVLPATDASGLNLTCADFPGGITNGDYYLTPFTAEAVEIDPVFWNAGVDSGYCDATFEVCIGLSGSNWEINPLTIILPNGVEIDVIAALAGGLVAPGTPITPTLWNLATSQLGDPACLNLIDIIGYYDDPNGTWQIVIPNSGSGTLNFSINAFDVVVSAASCPEITEDQVTPLPAVNGSVQGGTTQTFSILVPPVPASFPTIMASCSVIGEATAFSINCPLSVNDVNNISEFTLYPNPNKGVFNVSFEIFERNDVMIQVYDITGRAILNKNYVSRVGNFNEVIEMPYSLSAGFYVVNVMVGDSKLQKHFIIE